MSDHNAGPTKKVEEKTPPKQPEAGYWGEAVNARIQLERIRKDKPESTSVEESHGWSMLHRD